MVLHGYSNLEPIPVPEHTHDQISMVLPIPVSFPTNRNHVGLVLSQHKSNELPLMEATVASGQSMNNGTAQPRTDSNVPG